MEIPSDSDNLASDFEEDTRLMDGYSSNYPYYDSLGPAQTPLSAPNFPHSMYYASFYPPPSAMSSNDAPSGYEVEVR